MKRISLSHIIRIALAIIAGVVMLAFLISALEEVIHQLGGRLMGGRGGEEIERIEPGKTYLANMEGWKYAFEVEPLNVIALTHRPKVVCRNVCDHTYGIDEETYVLAVPVRITNRTDVPLDFSISPYATELVTPEGQQMDHQSGRDLGVCRNLHWYDHETPVADKAIRCNKRNMWQLPFEAKESYTVYLHFMVPAEEIDGLFAFGEKATLNESELLIKLFSDHFSDYHTLVLRDPELRDCRELVEADLSRCVR